MRYLVALLALICVVANAVGSPLATEKELKDWGVAPIGQAKRENLHSPTPTTIPGGKTIELYALIGSSDRPNPSSLMSWAIEAWKELKYPGEKAKPFEW